MMTKRTPLAFHLLLIILVVSLTIYACAEQNDDLSCGSLLSETSLKEVNTTFRVSAPPHINSFELADMIGLVVDNDSGAVIEVAPDRDMKVFWWRENSWEPIENGVDYLSAVDRLASKTNDDPGGTIYSVALNIPEPPDRVRVCIILEGLRDPDGVQSKVAAYTEVVLIP